MSKRMKLLVFSLFVTFLMTAGAIGVFADTHTVGHCDPTGTTSHHYAYSADECNRTINVSFVDTGGSTVRKVVIHTKRGVEATFAIRLGGYDIVGFSSNQSVLETCKMSGTSGTGTCTSAYLYVTYYFRTALSQEELNVTVKVQRWEPITLEVRHYVKNDPTISSERRDNYTLHSTTDTQSLNYYDSFSVSRRYITGYDLAEGYEATVSGRICYDALVGATVNMPSSPRCYSYSLTSGTHNIGSSGVSTYSESSDGTLSRCYNRKIWVEFFYDPKDYTISFDANGGSGAPGSIIKYYGQTVSIPTTVPTRSGYTFKGWGTTATATSASYQPGGAYTSNTKRTLYAVWESNTPATYTIRYYGNGGTGVPSDQTKYHGVALVLSSTVPTRSGYTFRGWSTSSTATTPTYGAGATYTANASVNLYAVWEQNVVTYAVTYHANGGTGAPSSQTKIHGEDLTLSATIPTRDGYRFLGWSVASTSNMVAYTPGTVYVGNMVLDLYAVWEEIAATTYTVMYDANGGQGAPASQVKTHDVALTLSSTVPTRDGYRFLGWGVSKDAQVTVYSPGSIYGINASLSLYAVWGKIPETYTVTYHANGGTGAPDPQTKTEDVALILSSTVPVYRGYTFCGWATSIEATVVAYAPKDTYMANASVILYAVWQKNPPVTYTVFYNANDGYGAPSNQTKTEGEPLVLSTVIPTRNGYTFEGWGLSADATSGVFAPGDSYDEDASVTMYAVWKEITYDFSVGDLGVSNITPYKYDEITVVVRCDNWDMDLGHAGIPVQVYYDGELIAEESVDFYPYGVADITFTLNVGSGVGKKCLEIRINWDDRENEARIENNIVSAEIDVQDFEYDVAVEPVISTENYCEGMEVVSSFLILNNGDKDVIPDLHNRARFVAYYYDGFQQVEITVQEWEDVVIPASGTNLIYFRWRIPDGLDGHVVYLSCSINADGSVNEVNLDNNTASFTVGICAATQTQTPDTRFEGIAPNTYPGSATPVSSGNQATWSMWEYEDGGFVLKKYGVQISPAFPTVEPSSACSTAVWRDGQWRIRAGYGISLTYVPSISTVSGYTLPKSSAYTPVQYAVARFPEFRYLDTSGNCRTLEDVGGCFQFPENVYADGNERVHFIPVYVKDGSYVVSVTASHVWTPAGMIEATRNARAVVIDGTVYDDWYQG